MVITFFYITIGNQAEAISLGDSVVNCKLAACANIFPMQSVFPWHDSLQHEQEYVLVLKTTAGMKWRLREFIEANHPYDSPCILSWDAEVNEKYGNWMLENLRQD